jgi:hypothetical protein
MARLPVGKNHDARTQFAHHAGDLEPVFEGVGNCAVGQVERLPMSHAENARSLFSFGGAFGG